MRSTHRGNALVETVVALCVLMPFLGGIALLGKQLDLKHKTFDALRYSLWERTVWSGHAKTDADVTIEALDRSFGNPSAGVVPNRALHSDGISQNPFWLHHRRSLLTTSAGDAVSIRSDDGAVPVDTGYLSVPGIAHGTGPVGTLAAALQMNDLNLNRRAFASAAIEANIRPLLAHRHSSHQGPLTQRAAGALLSDTWSPRDEHDFAHRVDRITANELVETLELPSRPLAMHAPSKGGPLYGEGQYGWDPRLRPRSSALPAAYVVERDGE